MNIKQKLGLGALVLGMSGCSPEAPAIKNLSTEEIKPRADENYVVNTDFDYCPQADVVMNVNRYHIDCNTNFPTTKSFIHYGNNKRNTNTLNWGNVTYIDDDLEGVLDLVYANGFEVEKISQAQNDWYNETVKKFNKDRVHQIWLERWHPDLLQ